ncbi:MULTISPECIES: hypothetical protein [Nocardia]|uniref:Uncharacterized protein n=2 Tax=Nocardia TaxID=1817 RepID=A0A2T2YXA0_9NOCA|nr:MULTISPECIES: hypothetical protein [Nocardia]MBF6243352.1 hypothetical protein [Nocardia elegans]MBF6450575.1 hypothetical protein [Nocardia elegans]PSR60124.1 hypothetical protein C8259_23775 [Nocardia nova]
MSGELITTTPSAALLVEEIVDRYGSVEQFCNQLRRDLDDPTVQLPRLTHFMPPDGPHSPPHLAWSQAPRSEPAPMTEAGATPPGPYGDAESPASGGDPAAPAPSRAQPMTAEAHVRRSLWHRLLAWF